MYDYKLYSFINNKLEDDINIEGRDNLFYTRFLANAAEIQDLYNEIYGTHPAKAVAFEKLVETIINNYKRRPGLLIERDNAKLDEGHWFLTNKLAGMSLYVDRFCGSLSNLENKLDYFEELGVNLLHLMPIFESPANESDGGYAVSNFREVDERFGTLEDLQNVQEALQSKDMYLMLDIVLNHTSHRHEWANKARQGETYYQDYFYFFHDRSLPDAYDSTMPDIFPESSPGNFTYVQECNKWVMTVFHNYQWDLN